jgi:predicted GIY-YIG superfamily endonuclease
LTHVVFCTSMAPSIATDVVRWLAEHEGAGHKGARNLRSKVPLQLVYKARICNRSLALKVERLIKKLPKRQKEAIVTGRPIGGFFDDDETVAW